ncbi:hypothetical protein ERJ75_000760400 [Trypanosoma vivax]|uniref:Uncharacterized protein n=1 Tax=Trypanosoma vivax (strain Y486) TaxID=1055687 RepID=G0TV59_TRYVY|nr:hypothetical protein TRVL_08564 [Trypanosoma vivax]KAH8614210.1 hypothetical protein ERJ75_000760400 [Trypanosoma vivax]CCC47825.1 conserved hypothetical protein [Trypanosoma vivax Y486]
MLYNDILHPVNLAWFAYDMLAVVVRSFSPETLVRRRSRRLRRGPGKRGTSRERRGRWGSHVETSSLHSSYAAPDSAKVSATVLLANNLPPQVPWRRVVDEPKSHRGARRSLNDSNDNDRTAPVIEIEERKKGETTQDSFYIHMLDWKDVDISKQLSLLSHVLRAIPVSVLHFLCQLETDVSAMRLMRFSDLNENAMRLLSLNEADLLSPNFIQGFLLTRCLLTMVQRHLLERICFETNIIVQRLRSKRTYRHVMGLAMMLASHTLTDPVANSILSTILLCTVQDYSPVSGPLRYTPVGLCTAALTGGVGVVLELAVVPVSVQFCQRVIVRICEGVEYLFLRRYRSLGQSQGHGIGKQMIIIPSSSVGDLASSGEESGHDSRLTGNRAGILEERPHQGFANDKASHPVLRAIIYRVSAALIAQCLVQHPISVVARVLYGRAVLHATGSLKMYSCAPSAPLTWSRFSEIFGSYERDKNFCGASGGVSVLGLLRRVSHVIGYEINTVYSSVVTCSSQGGAIADLFAQTRNRRGLNLASGLESLELMIRTIASYMPLYTSVHLTAMDKLLSFYMDMWVRLRGD